jgi:predicted ATP-grasp superfamily ATP-dependent carboligase
MQVRGWRDLESIRSRIDGYMAVSDVLVQEKLRQNDEVMSCCGFSVHGELVRHFQYVKLRQHPDEFGTGTFLKSIYNDQLLAISRKIIKHFDYTGIFEIEFLRNGDQWVVLEMNPRTWKSIHFATLCGQNMCTAYADYCRTGSVPETELDFETGKTWVDLGTDIPMLFKNRSWAHAGYSRDTYFCVLSSSDPLPFIMEIILSPFIAMGI